MKGKGKDKEMDVGGRRGEENRKRVGKGRGGFEQEEREGMENNDIFDLQIKRKTDTYTNTVASVCM